MSDVAEITVPVYSREAVEVRTAATVEVRFAERMIEVIAVPYEETTKVLYRDRIIDETIARGAFEGVQMRAKGWKVNRAHDRERPLGYVHKFKPRDERGLVTEIGPLSQHPRGRRRPRARRRRPPRRVDRVRRPAPERRGMVGRPVVAAGHQGLARSHRVDRRAGLRRRQGARRAVGTRACRAGRHTESRRDPRLAPRRALQSSPAVELSQRAAGPTGPWVCEPYVKSHSEFTSRRSHARADRRDDCPARSRARGAQRPHRRLHRRRPGRQPRPQQPRDGDDRRRQEAHGRRHRAARPAARGVEDRHRVPHPGPPAQRRARSGPPQRAAHPRQRRVPLGRPVRRRPVHGADGRRRRPDPPRGVQPGRRPPNDCR